MIILVMGGPRSGKTTLANLLAKETGLELIRTDDYTGRVSFKDVPKAVVADIKGDTIIEGVHAPRLIRYGVTPDYVIRLRSISDDQRHRAMNSMATNYAGKVDQELRRPLDHAVIIARLKDYIDNRRA